MCNIWQRKRDKEISPEELRLILTDPLFSEIQSVGINGGEPTLRSDLPDIGQVLVESLPKLRGMSIITNALRPRQVIERIMALAQVAEAANISFSVNVSLDGIGEDHDRNRGVMGNFAAAVEVIAALKQSRVPVKIGCTLTPLNCYGADDVLLWCEQNDIQSWEFRLAVDIKRVYNEGYSQRNPFTPEQRFHLIMFFDKLAHNQRIDASHRRFYRSLVGQLAFGLPRQAGCDWQSQGVTLDAQGNISYCSVQSPILGSALERSAWQIYREGLSERRRIIRKHCDNCQHDLLGPPSAKEMTQERIHMIVDLWRRQWRRLRKRFNHPVDTFLSPKSILPADHNSPSEWQHVLITGWYGTETAGDKAILGELLHFLKTYAHDCRVTLTTLDHKVLLML
jgi:MoaA/NifB/PqqE/SkfB family radical SAM enzyme